MLCRQIAKHSSSAARRCVFYVAPCGRRLRNEQEVDEYLMMTDSRLSIDMFCCEPDLRIDVEFVSTRVRSCFFVCVHISDEYVD